MLASISIKSKFFMTKRQRLSSFLSTRNALKPYNIKTLSEDTIDNLLIQAALRCRLQSATISSFPGNKFSDILLNLFEDSSLKMIDLQRALGTGALVTKSNNGIGNIGSFGFTKLIDSLIVRHGLVPETLADIIQYSKRHPAGLLNLEKLSTVMLERQASLSACLEQIYFLADHNSSITNQSFVRKINLEDLCHDVMLHAITLAEHQEGWSPAVKIYNLNYDNVIMLSNGNRYPSVTEVTCIPSRLKFALLEVVKNALHSTMKKYRLINGDDANITDASTRASPVEISIVRHDHESIFIKVRDAGVGLSDIELFNCHRFLWSTTRRVSDLVTAQSSYQPMSAPLQGLGAGLCLSQIYMSQFGGKLQLSRNDQPEEGITALLLIPLSTELQEVIP